jgi:hypothetical protein
VPPTAEAGPDCAMTATPSKVAWPGWGVMTCFQVSVPVQCQGSGGIASGCLSW